MKAKVWYSQVVICNFFVQQLQESVILAQQDRDCREFLKPFKFNDPKIKLSLLYLMWSYNGLFNDFSKEETSLKLHGIINIRKQTV